MPGRWAVSIYLFYVYTNFHPANNSHVNDQTNIVFVIIVVIYNL